MSETSYRIVLTSNPTDYIYIHFHPQRPDEVVYIGRGSGGRAWSSDGRSTAHQVWMLEWQALGYSPDQFVKVVFRGLTPEQAEKKEKEVIAFHKKRGELLFNDQWNADNIREHRNRFFPAGPQRDTKWKQKKKP